MARNNRGLSNPAPTARRQSGKPSMNVPGDGKVSKPVNGTCFPGSAAEHADVMQQHVGGGSSRTRKG